MGALSRVAAVAAAAAIAAAIVLLTVGGGAAPAAEPSAPLAVRAVLADPVVQLGDPVVTRVVVELDRNRVRPDTLHVAASLAPLTALSAPTRSTTRSGRLETVTIAQHAACLTAPCLARTVTLRPVRVTVTARSDETAAATAAWRPLRLRGRVTAADLAASTPRFAVDTAPGRPSYRVAPDTAATVLEVVAALAAAAAAALLALEALRLVRRRRRPADGDELSRALRLVREAEARPVPDRRRALALLARLLQSRDGALGRTARDLAWSRRGPEPPPVDELVDRVERGGTG
jgi:hypothetical protein